AGDVFAENAPHEFFAQPIRHSDGNIYVQVLRPFLAFDRYGTRQLVRFESGRYINIENPFNIEGEQTFGLRLGPVERLTGMSKSPKFQTQDYPRVRQLAADSALRMNVPITVTQLYALLRVRGEYDSSFFGPTLLAKKLLLRWQDPALFSLTPLKQSFLLGQGTDFQPLPRNSYLGFNPGKITEQTAFSGIDPIAKGSKVLADMAYSLDEIMRKDYTQNLRAKFFEVQYDPKNNDFFAHLKKGHFLLLKDKDGSLKVLTDQDIIKIIPKYPAEFAAQLLHYRGERVNMQLLDGKTFPLVDAYGGIAHASLRTIPTPLEQWEKEAFQGGDYLNQPFTSQDYARFMPITHQGGLSQLPSGTPSPKQPYVRTTPTMAERAELNRQKAAKTYPAERILPQAKSQASAAELNPDFKPLPSHDPSLFEPDPEATPFGQDPEELPDYVLQAMWDTNLIANYQKSLFVVNIPLNYVGPVKKFKSNEDGTIWYFAEVYHSFPAWDSGKVIQAGHYLDLQELTWRLRAWSYSPEEIERNFVEVTE
ncbi:MAG: hypothetical protein J5601_03460, partial [Elusimicrobiaceae bacterium]|nr:hypothetical protein [Elusimicrobiaceae bacterium]